MRSEAKQAARLLRLWARQLEPADPLAAVQLENAAYKLEHHRGQGRKLTKPSAAEIAFIEDDIRRRAEQKEERGEKMYVYIQSEPSLWTVGFYDPKGKWQPESDHNTSEDAAKRVHYLNGAVEPR